MYLVATPTAFPGLDHEHRKGRNEILAGICIWTLVGWGAAGGRLRTYPEDGIGPVEESVKPGADLPGVPPLCRLPAPLHAHLSAPGEGESTPKSSPHSPEMEALALWPRGHPQSYSKPTPLLPAT